MKKLPDLRPCPFCGSPAKMERDDHWNPTYYVTCTGDEACPGQAWATNGMVDDEDLTPERVAKRWNHRARIPKSERKGGSE
jgi:hypothetical protein